MKKIAVLSFAIAFAMGVQAQQTTPKKWSLIPRVGVNFSNLGDMDLYHGSDNDKTTPRTMTDLLVGAEFDYRVHPAVEVGVGAYYSRQGCHYKTYSDSYTTIDPDVVTVVGKENHNVHLQYLNIPVTGTLHLSDNIALKAGVQCGVYLSGNWVYDMSALNVIHGQSEIVSSTHTDDDLEWMSAKTVWSIPLGVEFEYQRVLFDVSYALPLTGFCKEVMLSGSNTPEKISKGCNKVLTFSVGYRF